MFTRCIVKDFRRFYRIVCVPVTYKSNRSSLKNWFSNNDKLKNNIIRAKQKLFEYGCCNDFKYFVTCTVNISHDRQNLDWLVKTTTQIIRDMRKRYDGEFKFLLIPELHSDGKSWHLHGLFDESFGQDFYVNEYNFLSWSTYDKIGFTSISLIRNYEASIKYITKYVKKGFESREKGKHLYFCSNNLNKSFVEKDLIFSNVPNLDFDYDFEYCNVKDVNKSDIDDIMSYLENDVYCDLWGVV